MSDPIVWALVLNSETARILRGVRSDGTFDAPERTMQTKHKDLKEIMSDRPGRTYESVGSRRSAMDYASDPVHDAQKRFVGSVVQELDQHLQKGEFSKLAVFASRPMLGMLRQEMTPALSKSVVSETDKNLVHETEAALGQIVARTVFAPNG